jgi:hypothetical protein
MDGASEDRFEAPCDRRLEEAEEIGAGHARIAALIPRVAASALNGNEISDAAPCPLVFPELLGALLWHGKSL